MFGLADKALAMIGGGLSIVLAGALAFTVISKNSEISTLQDSIHNPKTGYAVKLQRATRDLTNCRTNRITLEEATRRQNEAVAAAQAEGNRRVQAVTGQLANARQATASAERRAAAIMAARPGEDQCASADALILETLQ